MDTEKPRLHKLSTVIERTSLSRSTVYRLIHSGNLQSVRIGKALRVSETELARFIRDLESGEVKV